MKTFTNCAEKKAKQFLNLLQGYTKGTRMTAILVLLLMGVSSAWAYTATFRCVPALTFGNNWKNGNSCKVKLKLGDDKGDATYDMHATGLMYEKSGTLYEIYEGTASDLPYDGAKNLHFERWEGSAWKENQGQYDDWRNCTAWSGSMYYGEWGNYSYKSWNLPSNKYIYFEKPSEWTYAQFMVGHYSSSEGYVMTPLQNTKLYYVKTTQWDGYLQSAFIDANNKWGSESNSVGSRKLHADHSSDVFHYQELINTSNGYGLFTTNFKDDHSTVLSFSRENSYSILNKSQTITLQSYNLASKTYTNSSTVGSVSFSSIKMSSATSTTNSSKTITNSASADAIYTANVTLTASVNPGYKFDCWSDGDNQLGTNLTYSYSVPSTNKTVYARFSEITYSVQVKSADNNQGTISPANVNAGQFTGITITATPKIGYAFKNWTATAGITISNPNSASTTIKATKAGTVTANFEAQPATTIYLEPTGFWNSDNAKFVAHVWNTSGDDDITMKVAGEGTDKYYTCEVPYGYTDVVFYRVDPSNTSTIWNQTNDLQIPTNKNTLYEIKSTGEGTTTKAKGDWKAANLIYTITLGYCDFGTYGIKYNGQSYFSKPKENVTIDVPAGAQIEILEGQPFSNAYTGDVIKSKPTPAPLSSGHTLTVNGDIMLDDNFVTKKSHVVYLGVPNRVDTWNSTQIQDNTRKFYVWRTKTGLQYDIDATNDAGEYVFEINNIKYYQFTITAGCNDFRFEQKDATPENNTYSKTVWFPFQIPLTDVNCFTLDGNYTTSNGHHYYTGSWNVLPAQPGDYRLLYVEQVVEKSEKAGEEWKTIITRKKAHPSNIIRKGTARQIVSLHTYKDRTYMANAGGSEYESSNNPEIILQKYLGNDQWQDVECQMVYGPLETLPIMANLPGRKNASPGSNIDDLQHQDGIEIIKQDVLNHPDEGNGVWNFVVTQDGDNASVQWDQTHRYTGEYYIRTDNAEGGWDQYTLNDNYMTYSQYAKDHSGFSHYFCRWVEVSKDDNTKFVIANDYGVAISDTLAKDDYTNEHGDIAHDANIRWSWNMVNNEIARAYIQGTWEAGSQERNRNLVVNYKSSSTAADQEDLLDDSGDWIYQKDFTVKVGSHLNSLTAKYPVTSDKTQTFASNLDMLTGSSGNTNDYKVRVLYDFKINKTLVALVPNANEASIAIDVIIERVDQGGATQVQSGITRTVDQGATVYAVMSFTKTHIKGDASKYAKQFYWISFPFDVRISEVFGFGEYGKHWIIQWYDGAERAKNGCWIDSPTYWRFQTDTTDYFLEAGKGYVLTLDLDQMDVFTNTNQVSLYFPSTQKYKSVDGLIINDLSAVTLEPYTCTIQRNDRWIKDSHWHMLGVPSFANKGMNFTQDDVAYFYQYNSNNDTYTPTSSGSFNFNSMFSYMVQFAGTINWNEFSFTANGGQGLAAKKNANEDQDKHSLRLELQKNNSYIDQTFVQLQTEAATEMFDMNLDLTKMMNSGANIYSIIQGTESNIEVAGNVLPVQETIIPVGVVISAAGEYTFAMPDGTDGIVVELIDYETNTRTNMLLDEYSINLGKGTFENRFALHVKPNKTTTSLEDVNTNTTGVKKYLIDGVLYMQKDGALYDAQGKLVR